MARGIFRGGKVRRLSSARLNRRSRDRCTCCSADATTHIVARMRDPVPSDSPLMIQPTVPFAECPSLGLICVPGGFGVDQAMEDEETIAFGRREGGRAYDSHERLPGKTGIV